MQIEHRDDKDSLFARLQENEEVSEKFWEVEVSVLSILNFKDFFDRLLTEIRDNFDVDHVWISMISSGKVFSFLKSFVASEEFLRHLNVVEKNDFMDIVGTSTKPKLINTGLGKLTFLYLFDQSTEFKSMAIVPITFDGEVCGSLNFADPSSERFRPGLDPRLLEQLGVVVSICLSNVAAHEELKALAFKDPLTELLNRRAMEKALKREFNRARRYMIPLAVVFMDLDDFKQINDTYGHDIGDDVLKFVATSMNNMSRQSDIIARFAGDEFVLILPGTTIQEAQAYIDRLRFYFMDHKMDVGETQIEIGFSCGIASAVDEGVADSSLLLKRADELLFKAKSMKRPKNKA